MKQQCPVTPQILTAFGLPAQLRAEPVHGGHINDTFSMETPEGQFILQRVNRFVFPSPENIMENISAVTNFLRKKIEARGGDPRRETLTLRKTTEGGSFPGRSRRILALHYFDHRGFRP